MFVVLFIYLLLRLTIAVDELNWQSNWYEYEHSVLAGIHVHVECVCVKKEVQSVVKSSQINMCVGVGRYEMHAN